MQSPTGVSTAPMAAGTWEMVNKNVIKNPISLSLTVQERICQACVNISSVFTSCEWWIKCVTGLCMCVCVCVFGVSKRVTAAFSAYSGKQRCVSECVYSVWLIWGAFHLEDNLSWQHMSMKMKRGVKTNRKEEECRRRDAWCSANSEVTLEFDLLQWTEPSQCRLGK